MRILIVSPYFPPSATVAIVRISSLVNALLDKGHNITVIRNKYNKKNILTKTDQRLMRLQTYKVNIDRKTRYFEAKKRYEKVFRKVMNERQYDLVLITAGPFYTIPLCKIAKKEYNTKCIIDFRDLWIFDLRNILEFIKPVNLLKKIIYYPIEKENIKYADTITTVTDNWKEILERVYKIDKVQVVENGYDDKKLENVCKNNSFLYRDKFVIATFGKLSYYSRDYAIKFFNAMKKLIRSYPNILILHVGSPEKETEEIIKLTGFDRSRYINTGFIDYLEGMQILTNSNVNIVIDIRNGAMGTKFYDYVYLNKPLIYIGKKGTILDNLVRKFENGYSCYSEKQIITSIKEIIEEDILDLTSKEDIIDYSRSKQNSKFIKIIESSK